MTPDQQFDLIMLAVMTCLMLVPFVLMVASIIKRGFPWNRPDPHGRFPDDE